MIALCQASPHPVQSCQRKQFRCHLNLNFLRACFPPAALHSRTSSLCLPLFSLSLISLVTSLLFLFQRSRFQAALEVLHFISPFARLHFFPLNYFQLELPSRLSSFHFICSLHLKLTSSTSRLSSFRSASSSLQNISSELTLLRVDFTSFLLGTSLLT
jgi:hypothetical protein